MRGKYCQSCAMPIHAAEEYGTETDGVFSSDYCNYCYDKGAFTKDGAPLRR